ncbi:MAG: hypothetical protein V3V01_03230 [Acidimicrobiales bacterium]
MTTRQQTTKWTAIIDALDDQLRLQERALSGGRVPAGVVFDVPPVAMSTTERARANELLLRTDALLNSVVDMTRTVQALDQSPYSD